jgi:hypothetical protein
VRESHVRLLKSLAGHAGIEPGGFLRRGASVVLHQRLQAIADLAGLRIEKGFQLEDRGPISVERLDALQADSRLRHVARRHAQR